MVAKANTVLFLLLSIVLVTLTTSANNKALCSTLSTCSDCVSNDCVWSNCLATCEAAPLLSGCAQWTVGLNASHACDCSPNLFVGNSGSFDDGSGDDPYKANLHCRYFISPNQTANIAYVEFQSFNLDHSSWLQTDFVKIGTTNENATEFITNTSLGAQNSLLIADSSSTIPRRFCAASSEDSPNLLIDFVTDGSIPGGGWTATYGGYNFGESLCCGEWELLHSTGQFSDGSGGNSFVDTSRMNCTFVINPVNETLNNSTVSVELVLSKIVLNNGDSIVVWGETNEDSWEVATFTAESGERHICIPNVLRVIIFYNTSTTNSYRGFEASYSTHTQDICADICAPLTEINEPKGFFSDSPTTNRTFNATVRAQRNCKFLLSVDSQIYDHFVIVFNFTKLGLGSSITIQDVDFSTNQVVSSSTVVVAYTTQNYEVCTSSPSVLLTFVAGSETAGFFASFEAQEDTNQAEARLPLEIFYSRSNGPAWKNRSRWATAAPKCSWFGVRCKCGIVIGFQMDSNQMMTSDLSSALVGTNQTTAASTTNFVDLSSNFFSGTVPIEFSYMTELEYLDLSWNFFVGTIPERFATLEKLQYLSVSNNLLSGTIPAFVSKLRWLDVSNNAIHGTLPDVIAGSGVFTSANCKQTFIYPAKNATQTVICAPFRSATCGDGVVARDPSCAETDLCCGDLGEQCDDGNTVDGDGCSSTCEVEGGFTCTGQPSVCGPVKCLIGDEFPLVQTQQQILAFRNGSCVSIPQTVTISSAFLGIENNLCGFVSLVSQSNISTVTFDSGLQISNPLEMKPSPSNAVILLANSPTYVFNITSGSTLSLENLAVMGVANGGGVLVNSGAHLIVKNCTFTNFSQPPIKVLPGGTATISFSVFSGNRQWGAIDGGGHVVITNSQFANNSPQQILTNSTLVVSNTTFDCSGTTHIAQGSAAVVNVSTDVDATNCVVHVALLSALATENSGTAENPLRGFQALSQVISNGLEIALEGQQIDLNSVVKVDGVKNVLFQAAKNATIRLIDSGMFSVTQSSNVTFSSLHFSNHTISSVASSVISASRSSVSVLNCKFADLGQIIALSSDKSRVTVLGSQFEQLGSVDKTCTTLDCFNGAAITVEATAAQKSTESYPNSIHVKDSSFSDCRADRGGAIFVFDANAQIVIDSSEFTNCSATSQGGAICAQVGAISVFNSTFDLNSARDGGAIWAQSGDIFVGEGSIFHKNTGKNFGGALYLLRSSAVVANVSFVSNMCKGDSCFGGAIHSGEGALQVSKSNFTENQAFFAGAVGLDGCTSNSRRCNTTIADCSFESNLAEIGGGALAAIDSSSANISNSVFSNNAVFGLGSGGALHFDTTSYAIVQDSVFWRNSALQKGGAVSTTNSIRAVFRGCLFQQNSAESGAAINGDSRSSLTIANCSLVSNLAELGGGGIQIDGLAALVVTFSHLLNNSATSGGAVKLSSVTPAVFANSTFAFNTATDGDGGALLLFFAVAQVLGCRMEHNTAIVGGGAIMSSLSLTDIQNVRFEFNKAHSGGAVATTGEFIARQSQFAHNEAEQLGGAAFGLACEFTCIDCDFQFNKATYGGALTLFDNTETVNLIGGRIEMNQADLGGAVALFACALVATDVFFSNNLAYQYGGAFFAMTVELTLTQSTANNNTALNGGFAFLQVSSSIFQNSTFAYNSALQQGGVLVAAFPEDVIVAHSSFEHNSAFLGAAFAMMLDTAPGATATIAIQNMTCAYNLAYQNGACVAIFPSDTWSGALVDSDVFINGSNFHHNDVGRNGGSIAIMNVRGVHIDDSAFVNNTVQRWPQFDQDLPHSLIGGGALWLASIPKLAVENCLFENNSVQGVGNGGAILIAWPSNSVVELETSTFSSNTALEGGGGAIFWAEQNSPRDVNIRKNENFPNDALYGADTASTASHLVVTRGAGTETQRYVGRGLPFPTAVQVAILDVFNNIVKSENSVFAKALVPSSSGFGLVGADIVPFVNGVAEFSQLGLIGAASETAQLSFTVLGSSINSSEASVLVTLSFELQRTSLALVVALGSVSVTICLLLLLFVQFNRNNTFIRRISPNFASCTVLGAAFISSTTFYFYDLSSDFSCNAIVWQLSIGMALLLGALFLKKYRIFKIFVNPHLKAQNNLRDKHLFVWLGGCLLVDLMCLLPHTALNKTYSTSLISDSGYVHHTCKVEMTPGIILVIIFKGAQLVGGVMIAFLTRNVATEYNESRTIGFCLYNMFLAVLIAAVCVGTMGGKFEYSKAMDVTVIVSICSCSAFSVCFLFFRQLEAIVLPQLQGLPRRFSSIKASKSEPSETSRRVESSHHSVSGNSATGVVIPVTYVYRNGKKQAISTAPTPQL